MQHWTKIPGLSQEDMETFFQNAMLPGSELKHHGGNSADGPHFCHL